MTTLEKIKTELHATAEMHEDGHYYLRDKWVDEIINKYAEQEQNKNIKEIEEVINCDADAETKCKMISNILTAKPHYFEEQEPKIPCDLCGFNMDEVCEYLSVCPAIGKAVSK